MDWQNVAFARTNVTISVGDWVKVSGLKISGLSLKSVEGTVFVREEFVQLWDRMQRFITMDDFNGLIVEGPPGVGKSTEVWTWACFVSSQLSKSVFWAHIYNQRSVFCVQMTDSECRSLRCTLEASKAELAVSSCEIVILDGYREEYGDVYQDLFAFLDHPQRKACLVTSLAKNLYGDRQDLSQVDKIAVGGWSLTDCKTACRDPTFFDEICPFLDMSQIGKASQTPNSAHGSTDGRSAFISVEGPKRRRESVTEEEINDLIEQKYFYAGGSARWMFTMNVPALKRVIQDHIERVTNFEEVYNGFHGLRCPTTNHLVISLRDGSSTGMEMRRNFVSKYVAGMLFENCKVNAFELAYSLARENKNPSVRGWIQEFDLIDQIKERKSQCMPLLLKNEGIDETWLIPGFEEFDPKCTLEVKSELEQCYWLRPVRWNQAGYDLVRMVKLDESKYILQLLQISGAVTHDLNLRHFADLAINVARTMSKETAVEIYVLVPEKMNKPKLNIQNQLALAHFNVGSGLDKWTGSQILDYIQFRTFKTREKGTLAQQ